MLKVNYPNLPGITGLHERYLHCFDTASMQKKLDKLLRRPNLKGAKANDVKKILIASIEELFSWSEELKDKLTGKQKDKLKEIFNYDQLKYGKKMQPLIAEFFMDSPELNISTCYFCNIDHINSFDLIDDFENGFDLVKRGTESDLLKIQGITKKIAAKIMLERANVGSVKDLNISDALKDNIRNLKVRTRNNQFTLDHVLDKATNPIAALSLYNFVPCCYSCNSKFKRSEKLIRKNAAISPTSAKFALSDKVRFKICFPLNPLKNFRDINVASDFVLNFEIDQDRDEYENYLRIFKLRARYIFHKKEVVALVSRRKAYSDSQIAEIAKITGRSIPQINKDIFGEELFERSPEEKPLTKLKRDMAADIGIKGVIR